MYQTAYHRKKNLHVVRSVRNNNKIEYEIMSDSTSSFLKERVILFYGAGVMLQLPRWSMCGVKCTVPRLSSM